MIQTVTSRHFRKYDRETDQPTDRPTDGQTRSWENFTSNNVEFMVLSYQIDSARMSGLNEVLAVLLMATKLGTAAVQRVH